MGHTLFYCHKRTISVVGASEERRIEGAPIAAMGESAVDLTKYYQKERDSLEAKKAHEAWPLRRYQRLTTHWVEKGFGIARCRGMRVAEKK